MPQLSRKSRERFTGQFNVSRCPIPRLIFIRLLRLVFFFQPAVQSLFAATELIGKITRRRRGEIDSRCDAGDENAVGKKSRARRQDREAMGKGKGRRVRLLRRARHYCSRKKFQIRERMRRNEKLDSRIRASIFDEPRCPRITKCLAEEFRKVKTLRSDRTELNAAANASCKLRE